MQRKHVIFGYTKCKLKEQKVLSEYCGENRQMVFNTHQNQITKGSNTNKYDIF